MFHSVLILDWNCWNTNGEVTTDNVSDDNGTTITDGLGGVGATTFFPYIGKPNTPAGGGNP